MSDARDAFHYKGRGSRMALPAILCACPLVGGGAEPPPEEHVRVLAQTVKRAEFASATSITGDI
ncbi:efflux RND transporter periplasmic adaptor subunit, partial [Pseudomonas aeruginosa]